MKNVSGEITAQSKVTILYGPKFIKELLSVYNVKEHDVSKISAEIDANPKPEISWSKEIDGSELETIVSNEKFKLETQQNNVSLIIKDSLLNDSASYICIAKNKINEA